MHIVASFDYASSLEMAFLKLEQNGIEKKNIVAIPLDKRAEDSMLSDTLQHSDGKSLLDKAAIIGLILMIFGFIYGYVLAWGPIIFNLEGATSIVAPNTLGNKVHKTRTKNKSKQEHTPKRKFHFNK